MLTNEDKARVVILDVERRTGRAITKSERERFMSNPKWLQEAAQLYDMTEMIEQVDPEEIPY